MSGKYPVRRLVHYFRNEGLVSTGHAVIRHAKSGIKNVAEGTPGYYRLQFRLLCRRYDPTDITPVMIPPRDIQFLTGVYERRHLDHLDYVPHFGPRETSWREVPYEVPNVPFGSVIDGDWDQPREKFSRLLLYRGLRQWATEGMEWKETEYYEGLLDKFITYGWSNSEAKSLANERCEHIETMYERIRSEGYQSQRALNGHPLHEVTVTVARDGEVLYNSEGRHRLSIAKLLDVAAIPVLVLIRHEQYDGPL